MGGACTGTPIAASAREAVLAIADPVLKDLA